MKSWQTYGILAIFIAFAAILNYLPHYNYPYPLHVDEWVHFQYSNSLSSDAPQYFGQNRVSLETGFHLILASLNSVGVPYLLMFRVAPIFLTILICLSLFILTRRMFNTLSALFAVLFFALLKSSVAILGPVFLVPMSVGLVFIPIGLFLLHLKSKLIFLPFSGLLIIHPPSAIAFFLLLSLFVLIKKQEILKNLGLLIVGGLIALPLYLDIFLSKGVSTVNYLSFTIINSPLFIPRFLSYFSVIIIAVGIYYSVLKEKYFLSASSFVLLLLALIFFRLNLEVFIPYARTLMYLFVILAIAFGVGCSSLISFTKSTKIKYSVAIMLVLLSLVFMLPSKLDSNGPIYHIIEDKDYAAFRWINENISGGKAVLDPWKANAFTPIAEKEVYSRIVQGPSSLYEQRNTEIRSFFEGNCTNTELLKNNNLTIVYGNCDNPLLKEVYPNVYVLAK